MHFFIHNSTHSGDVIFTRAIIITLMEKYPDLQITLECMDYNVYLWEDLGLPVLTYAGDNDYYFLNPTSNCPPDAVFLNMWFGVYPDICANCHNTYLNNIHTFNRYMERYHLQHLYQLPVPEVAPAIKFLIKPSIFPMKQNGIFVENGKVRSGQSNFPMNESLEQIVKAFPQFTFYCSSKPLCTAPNLVDCSEFNMTLIQLSEVSNHCQALLTVGSGVDAASYTEENRGKPRCLAGMTFRGVIWDNSSTCYADDIEDIFNFLRKLPCKRWFKFMKLLPQKL